MYNQLNVKKEDKKTSVTILHYFYLVKKATIPRFIMVPSKDLQLSSCNSNSLIPIISQLVEFIVLPFGIKTD